MDISYDLGISLLAGLIGLLVGIPITIYFIDPMLEKRRQGRLAPAVRTAVDSELWPALLRMSFEIDTLIGNGIDPKQLNWLQAGSTFDTALTEALQKVGAFLNRYRNGIPAQAQVHLITLEKCLEIVQLDMAAHRSLRAPFIDPRDRIAFSIGPELAMEAYGKLSNELIKNDLLHPEYHQLRCPKCGDMTEYSRSRHYYCANCQLSVTVE